MPRRVQGALLVNHQQECASRLDCLLLALVRAFVCACVCLCLIAFVRSIARACVFACVRAYMGALLHFVQVSTTSNTQAPRVHAQLPGSFCSQVLYSLLYHQGYVLPGFLVPG